MNKKKVTAIILAAGNSVRYGQNRNKNLEIVNNQTILEYSLNEFNKNKRIDNIIIATKKSDLEEINKIIYKTRSSKPIKTVLGGKTRQESVYNSINSTDSNIVIIHDAARPMIKQEYIDKCIDEMDNFKGVTIGVKSKDTIKIASDDGIIEQTTNRANTWIIQTPQCFNRVSLLEAHDKFKNDPDITDDCMILERNNEKVKIISGDYSNIKLTTFDDLNLVNEYLKNNL